MNVAHAGSSNVDARNVSLANLISSATNHLNYEPGSLTISGTTPTTSSDAGGDLAATWDEFPLGTTTTFTFQARIQASAPPQTSLVESATLDWTSATGDLTTPQSSNSLSVERTGNTSDPGTTANDHANTDTGSVLTLPAIGAKTVSSTSLTETGSSQHDGSLPDLLVGESIVYTITATLPEGTTPLTITDQLPTTAGTLQVTGARLVSTGANITLPGGSPAITLSDTNSDTFDDQVVFNFGSVTNTADGVSNAGDVVTVEVTGFLVDVAANADGQVLVNQATINYGTGQTVVSTNAEVVAPALEIDKTISQTTGPAGSTVTYTLVINHAANSTNDAYDVIVADALTDANLTLVSGTVTSTAGTITTGNTTGDSTIAVDLGTVAQGATVTITFDALIDPALAAAVAVNNTSNLTWDSLPGTGGRVGTDNDPATFTTTAPQVDLSIVKSDALDPVTVGDSLTYTLVVTNNGPSTATNVTATDSLPANITYDSASTTQGTVSQLGTTVTALIGTLGPNESATITISVTAPLTEQTLNNNAAVTANENDTDPSNNTDAEPTVVLATADLRGTNWVDINANGALDPGEIVLPGVLLTLTGTETTSGASVTRTTTSLADGTYSFLDLREGTYTVTQTQPSLFADSGDYLGNEGGTIPSNDQLTVNLSAGDSAVDYNFTEAGLGTMLSKRSLLASNLAGTSFNDAALDAAFAALSAQGLGDLDGDGDTDNDDRILFLAGFGGSFL